MNILGKLNGTAGHRTQIAQAVQLLRNLAAGNAGDTSIQFTSGVLNQLTIETCGHSNHLLLNGEEIISRDDFDFLIDALSNPKVMLDAISILGMLGPEAKPAVGKLINILEGNNDPKVKIAIANTFSKIGPDAKDATQALAKTLTAKNNWVKIACAKALREIGPDARDAVPALT